MATSSRRSHGGRADCKHAAGHQSFAPPRRLWGGATAFGILFGGKQMKSFRSYFRVVTAGALALALPAALAAAAPANKGGKSAGHRKDAGHRQDAGKGHKGGNSAEHRQDGSHRQDGA